MYISCTQVKNKVIECTVRVETSATPTATRATAKVKGAKSTRVRSAACARSSCASPRAGAVTRSTRVVVKYAAGTAEGRVIVRLGKRVKVLPR